MGNTGLSCGHETSQTIQVNRALSARVKSQTPVWQDWVDLNTLRPSQTSWTRLRNKFYATIYVGKEFKMVRIFFLHKQSSHD